MAVVVAVLVGLAGAAEAHALPILTHHGRWLTDPQGRVVVLHGLVVDRWPANSRVNIMDLDPANVDLMADNGFNVARVNVTWSGYEPSSGTRLDNYLDPFRALDDRLADHGIYDLLTSMQGQYAESLNGWGFPEWTVMTDGAPNTAQPFGQGYLDNPAENRAWDNFWANAAAADGTGVQDHYANFLTRLAKRFTDSPALAGIDVMNEPWPGSQAASCASPAGCPPQGFDETALTSFSNRAAKAVRAGDPEHIVFVEPNLTFDFGSATGLGKLDDPNVALAYHVYCIAYVFPGAPDPNGNCATGEDLSMSNGDAYSSKTGAGLIDDEMGNQTPRDVNNRLTRASDAHMVGWVYWSLEDCCNSAAAVVADGSKPYTAPGNLRAGQLDALVRAYPRKIAGTPTAWSYDPATRAFALSYTTKLVDGTDAAGMETEAFIPARHYPDGYRAEVSGARIVSGSSAGLLRLCNLKGSDAVAMKVTPAAGGSTDLPTAASGAETGCREPANETAASPGSTVTAGPTPGAPGSETISSKDSGSVRLPSTRRCVRRRLVVHFRIRRGARLLRASVRVDGRRVRVRRHGRVVVAPATLRRGHTAPVDVRAALRVRFHGHTRALTVRRTYRRCGAHG